LKAFSIHEYAGKWDALKAQVDEALENLKDVGTNSVEANISAMRIGSMRFYIYDGSG
jgi:hypothetical protein